MSSGDRVLSPECRQTTSAHRGKFGAAWHVPAAAATAQTGQWVPGPGADYFTAAEKELDGLPFIAEDLGLITPDVGALRDRFGLPGMRVLQFAFDGHPDNPHLPDNYAANTVVYTGTHDNPPTRGWFESLPAAQRQEVANYLERRVGKSRDAAAALIELAWSSVAALAIAPLQDLLNLGNDARMNLPGHAEGNWRWRFTEDMLTPEALGWLRDLTQTSGRMLSEPHGFTERHVA
jgi:4-alpha-glucanotransferase